MGKLSDEFDRIIYSDERYQQVKEEEAARKQNSIGKQVQNGVSRAVDQSMQAQMTAIAMQEVKQKADSQSSKKEAEAVASSNAAKGVEAMNSKNQATMDANNADGMLDEAKQDAFQEDDIDDLASDRQRRQEEIYNKRFAAKLNDNAKQIEGPEMGGVML